MADPELTILLPALIAGLLVSATHVPLGMWVLARGIVFIDIAIAQIAGVGVIAASLLGFEEGMTVQLAALTTALLGALLLTWTEQRWPEVQEAIIGSVFVLAATLSVLLLAGNPHAGEHLREMLIGQILWVGTHQLIAAGVITAAVCAIWFGAGEQRVGRIGFYALFGLAVTVSVQLVGIYLVFSTLIMPALATRNALRHRLAKAYGVGALGYGLGLIASVITDLPTGPVIAWALAIVGLIAASLERNQGRLS
jgi:zinc/manganese transport system permease protein